MLASQRNAPLPLFDQVPDTPQPSSSERIGDITAGKHGGNAHSQRAHEINRHSASAMAERARLFVASQESSGATVKEFAAIVGKQLNQVSGRFSQLKADKKIFDSGRSREGCTVWVARAQWQNGSAQ